MCDLKSGERLNFYRMSLLILDVGTYTLQSLFKKEYSATGDLQTFLNSKNGTLRKLYKRKVINQAVKELLQPSNGAKPVLKKFDISLVITLLTNLCPIAQPGTGWNKPPAANDTSTGADILWLRIARNKLFAHRSESSMADAIFHKEWNKIVNSISRLSNQLEKKKQNQIRDDIANIEKAHINWEREKEINGHLFDKRLHDIYKKLEKMVPDSLEVVSCDEAEDARDAEIPTGPDGILCVLKEYPKLKLDLPRDSGEAIAQHLYKAKLINRDEYEKVKDSSRTRRVCIDRLLKMVVQGKPERLECFFNVLKMECPCLAIALSRSEVIQEDRIKFQQVKESIVIDGICTITVNHGIDELDIRFFKNHFCDSSEVIDGINDELLSQFLISIWEHSKVTYSESLHDMICTLFGTMQLHHLQVESMLQNMLQADLFDRWKNFRNSKLHWKVLDTCLPIFVRDLNFEMVFAHICQKNLLENSSCSDISKQATKSNKTRMLLCCFQQKNRSVYEQFKECLVLSQQSQLKNVLETEEAKLSHGTTKTEEKSSNTADQSSWRALRQWIQIAVMPLLAPFARKFQMRFISAEDGSIILKFEALKEFNIELLDQSEVQHDLGNLLRIWCHDSRIKVDGPVYVTVYILSPGEEGREEDIHFHLDFEAFHAQKELKAHLESHERKLLVEELNPSRLHRWMFDQPDVETENKEKMEDIVSQRGLSRREKMELLLDIIIRLENSRGILEQFCKENDKYVYDKVFKKLVQMPSPGKLEMDPKASLSYQKGRGQQKLFSMWINIDKEPHGSQPGQFVLSEVHTLEEIQDKYTQDAEQSKHSSRQISYMDPKKAADSATTDLKHLSPIQIWEGDIEPAKSVVVKNISSTIIEETLQNYLEVVTGEDLTSLYFYPAVTSVCLAVFKNDVADIEEVQNKAQKRPLEKTVLELLPLGGISGLLLSNISGPVGDDGLTLYFESRKCGSQGADVMDCKQLLDLNLAVIKMNASPEVFKKIVNKLDHQTAGVTFAVEPYYATFHDPVFDAIQERDIKTVRSNMANKPTGITTPKPAVPPSAKPLNTGFCATLSPDLKPFGLHNNSAGREGGSRRKEIQDRISSPQSGSGSENYMKFSNNPNDEIMRDSSASLKSSEQFQFASSSSDNNGYSMRTQTLPDSNIFPIPDIRQPQAYNNNQHKSSSGGLQIFTNSLSPFSVFPDGSKSSGPHPGCSSVPNVNHSKKTKKKNKKVEKSSDPLRSRSSANKSQLSAVPSVIQGLGDIEGQSKMDTEHESETVPMALEDIMLLIIASFQKKCTFCKVVFDTRQEVVRLSGQKSDVQKAKLMMNTTLQRKHEEASSSDVTELHQELLVLQKTKDAIRVMLKSKRIYAFVLIKEDKRLHSYALNHHQAKNGLDLIEQSLVQSTVSLGEGQDKLLSGSEWTSLVQGIQQGNIIKIHQDTRMVEIGGLDPVAVQGAQNEVTTFLKDKKPPDTFKQVMDGAIARCFKTELADGTRDKVKNSGGSLKMQGLPHQSGSDKFQIEVEVLGSDSAVEAFRTALKSIWHERLDLYTLSSSEDELQLVVEALSKRGKDFIKSFEGRHHCYIDLTLPAGKFEISMKYSAPTGDRKKADSQAVLHAKPPDYSAREFHLKQKMEPRARDQRGLERPLYKRIGSVPNLFHSSPMQSQQARFEVLDKQETDDFASLGYQKRPHSPQFRRRDIADELLSLPRAVHEYASEKSITLEGLEDKTADMRKEIKVGSVSIVVKQGDITKEQAYALLNIVPPSRDLSKDSVISQSFVKAGGQELIKMYNNKVQSEEDGFVLTECTGNLKCDVVLHVMLKTRVDDTEREVRKVMTTCFNKCKTLGVTTLALPPLGCGRLHRYKEDSVVEAMLEETLKLALGTPGQMRKVTIVVYDQDLCQKFYKKLSSLEIHATPSHPFLDLSEVSQEKKEVAEKQNVSDDMRDQYLFDDEGDSKNKPLLHSESSPAILHDQSKKQIQFSHSSEHQERERTASNAFKLGATKESAVTVKVFAKDKHTCLECVKNLAKEMKENYLFESEPVDTKHKLLPEDKKKIKDILMKHEASVKQKRAKKMKEHYLFESQPVDKKHKLLPEDKKKIKDILSKHEASVKQKQVMKGVYILKGWKEEVYAAHNAILKVLFESSETTQNRKFQHKRPSSDFWMSKTFEQPETPEYWSMGNNVIKDLISKFVGTVSGKKSKLVNVDSTAFHEIVKLVDDTWQRHLIGQGSDAVNLRHTRIKVSKVERVENLDLFDLYFKRRQEIFKSLWKSKQESFPQLEKVKGCREGYIKTSRVGKCLSRDIYPEINEYYFFHGTKVDKIEAICENGLDCRLGSEKAKLGAGVYGAESSTKSDQYTDAKQARTIGEKKMFLMRMVLGNICVCTDPNPHKYRRPPCRTCIKDDCANPRHTEGYFDSVVGDMGKLFREFVVYDKNQCYPEYIITYVRA